MVKKLSDLVNTAPIWRTHVTHQANACRASSFPSPLTRRTAAGDHYYKLMEPYCIAKRNIPNYPKAIPCINQL